MFDLAGRMEHLEHVRDTPNTPADEPEQYEDGSDGTSYGDYVARRRAWQEYLQRQEEELRRIQAEYEEDDA
jgi:hypothetical protein